MMDIPLFAPYLQLSNDVNWKYQTKPSTKYCLAINGNSCYWPRGKVMGGNSVLNYMIATRGGAEDYDKWPEMGRLGLSRRSQVFQKDGNDRNPGAEVGHQASWNARAVAHHAPKISDIVGASFSRGWQRTGLFAGGLQRPGDDRILIPTNLCQPLVVLRRQ